MVEPAARIRAFEPTDKKLVQFIIGKDCMEPLAVANRKVYFHPLTLALWVGLSALFVQIMGWWPQEGRTLGFLSPVPAFACMAVPLMFLSDWLNRPAFEDQTQDVLRRADLVDIPSYYSRSPSSGFWLLEYGEKFVGLIALDASLDSTSNKTITSSSTKFKNTKGTSAIATIRHFYVEEGYRLVGMQKDLLAHAVKHAFSSDKGVDSIRAFDSPLRPYIGEALRQQGFRLEQWTEKVGVLKWQNSTRVLSRTGWETSSLK